MVFLPMVANAGNDYPVADYLPQLLNQAPNGSHLRGPVLGQVLDVESHGPPFRMYPKKARCASRMD